MVRVSVIGIILLLTVLLNACREECIYKPKSLAGVDFYTVIDGTVVEAGVNLSGLKGVGREDSLLYSNRANIRSVTLPMNGMAEETGFIFVFDEGADTIMFSYEVVPWFLSPECGFILNFELTGALFTTNRIDSVVIVTPKITSFDDTNIRIYH
ncbi:MAG: hypothetical protein EA408_10475 [Marinilabiliales bacterium]|nr:MAG: hypothetical protein EA408_10475 [Marinilabiliales bacterium]